MKTKILVIDFFVATLFAVVAQKSFADIPPPGSYTQSCRDIWIEGVTLHANCKDLSGQFVPSPPLDISTCKGGDIFNANGQLGCKPPAHRPNPPGSYLGSCTRVSVDSNDTLHATCKNRAGEWIATHLDNISTCRGVIENQDGQLRCSGR